MIFNIILSVLMLRENLAELAVLIATFASRDIIVWLKNKKNRTAIQDTLATIVADLSSVKSELQFNGGKTTKDLTMQNHNLLQQFGRQITELFLQLREMKVQNRAKLEQQLNDSPDCQLIFNSHGSCTFANETVQEMFSKGFEAFEDNNWFQFIRNQVERERVKKSWDFSISNRIAFTEEFQVKGKLSLQKVFMNAKPIFDDDGKLIWYIAKIKLI